MTAALTFAAVLAFAVVLTLAAALVVAYAALDVTVAVVELAFRARYARCRQVIEQ
jgi:hypothetical protein